MKIAISGLAGSGKTELAKALYGRLKPRYEGLALVIPSFKDLAKDMGISLMEFQALAEKDESIDKKFDEYIVKKCKEATHCIAATWLAIWMVDADLKVYLYADEATRARRVAERDGMSYMNALTHIRERDKENKERYKRIYNIDLSSFNDVAHITLNTSKLSVEEEIAAILSLISSRE